jgi:photosystem II stability/assembly factor-like uncharacterized protein
MLTAFPEIASGQQFWTRIPIPGKNEITCLHETGGIVLLGTLGGVYRSADSGATWTETSLGFMSVSRIASNDDGLCAAAGSRGVFLSTDAGFTWTETQLRSTVHAVAVAPDGALYAGSGGWSDPAAVHISTDRGHSWMKRVVDRTDFQDGRVRALLISSYGDILAGVEDLTVTPHNRIYQSTNKGISWEKARHYGEWHSTCDLMEVEGLTITGGYYGHLLYSRDQGYTWEPITLGDWGGLGVTAIAASSDGAIFACSNVLFRLPDTSLSTWTVADSVRFTCMLAPFHGVLLGGSEAGLFRADASGSGWKRSEHGLQAKRGGGLTVDFQDRLWLNGYTSSDHGRNWELRFPPDSVSGTFSDPDGRLFIWSFRPQKLHRSVDGMTWETLPSSPATRSVWFMKRIGDWLLTGGQFGLWRSSDNGYTWEALTSMSVRDAVEGRGGVLLATTMYTGVYRSDPSWKVWVKTNSGIPGDEYGNIIGLRLVADDDGTLYVSTGEIHTDSDEIGLFRSTDNGSSWTSVLKSEGNILKILLINQDVIVIATFGEGILLSRDMGATWSSLNDGLRNPYLHALVMDEAGYLYAGSYGAGLFRSTGSFYSCTKRLHIADTNRITAMASETVRVVLRASPPLARRDDLVMYARIRFDSRYLTFMSAESTSSGKMTVQAGIVADGMLGVSIDGVAGSNCDILAVLNFVVHGSPALPPRTTLLFDSLSATTQCTTSISGEPVELHLLSKPFAWSIGLSPNPATSQIIVDLNAPYDDNVELAVVDMLGRTVQQLHRGPVSAGYHTLTFDIKDVATGSYWIRLRTADVQTVKRFVALN